MNDTHSPYDLGLSPLAITCLALVVIQALRAVFWQSRLRQISMPVYCTIFFCLNTTLTGGEYLSSLDKNGFGVMNKQYS